MTSYIFWGLTKEFSYVTIGGMKNVKRITISELQDRPASYVHECHSEGMVEVTQRGKTAFYMVSPNMVNTSASINSRKGGEEDE